MVLTPSIMRGHVMHARLSPRKNAFRYGIYYLAFPISQAQSLPVPVDRFAPLSFSSKDHGPRDGSDLCVWVKKILDDYGIQEADGEIVLVCMPCVLGYVFNPVSFWLCYDKNQNIRAVLCEVHNTFNETHTYICAHSDYRPINGQDTLWAKKLFHVSPFLERVGAYKFQFDIEAERFNVSIDYYNQDGAQQLLTYLRGSFEPMTKSSLRRAFWGYPLVTFKAVALIHWQAIKLLAKGIGYIRRPLQNNEKTSACSNLTKI